MHRPEPKLQKVLLGGCQELTIKVETPTVNFSIDKGSLNMEITNPATETDATIKPTSLTEYDRDDYESDDYESDDYESDDYERGNYDRDNYEYDSISPVPMPMPDLEGEDPGFI